MYAKIYEQIFDSSIAEDWKVRHVFEDLIKLANAHGEVDMTHEAIARRTNVPIDIVSLAISELEKPDPKSRNPLEQGRRLLRLDQHRDWGWRIVNHGYYRALRSEDDRRAAARIRQQQHRKSLTSSEKHEKSVTSVTPGDSALRSASVSVYENLTPEGSPEGRGGGEVPTLEQCVEYGNNPACAFPPKMVKEWYDRQCDRGWGNDWRARMRSAVATYREMDFKRRQMTRKTDFNPNKPQEAVGKAPIPAKSCPGAHGSPKMEAILVRRLNAISDEMERIQELGRLDEIPALNEKFRNVQKELEEIRNG